MLYESILLWVFDLRRAEIRSPYLAINEKYLDVRD
jgi:hypothetical protein